MKDTSISRKCSVFGLLIAIVVAVVAFPPTPAHAATETARVVKYSQDDIVTVHAKLRYSTLIVLPQNEEILDFTTGDKDFWIINGAHNVCYIHPAQAGILSNLNLITASGHVYSFRLEEISNEPKEQSACGEAGRVGQLQRRKSRFLVGPIKRIGPRSE